LQSDLFLAVVHTKTVYAVIISPMCTRFCAHHMSIACPFSVGYVIPKAAFDGLEVSVFASGPMGLAAAGSGLAEDDGFLWVIKIRRAHFLRRRNKAVSPMPWIYGM
jgi:hypothetical protein